eukprot:5969233-Pleurochrysis_carterae.AAC.4
MGQLAHRPQLGWHCSQLVVGHVETLERSTGCQLWRERANLVVGELGGCEGGQCGHSFRQLPHASQSSQQGVRGTACCSPRGGLEVMARKAAVRRGCSRTSRARRAAAAAMRQSRQAGS